MPNAATTSLMGLGMPGPLATAIGITKKTITGVGTTQGGSSPVVYAGDFSLLTTAAGATACTIDSGFPVSQSAVVVNISTVTGLLFPPTSGTINGGSANASVAIPPGASAEVTRTSATGFWVQFGTAAAGSGSVVLGGVTDGVTAFAGGGQASATQLTGIASNVTTVATIADSVKLPLAQAGMVYMIRNNAANATQVFGAGTDTINGVATATGVSQAATTSALYFATTSAPAAKWFRILSA